MKHSNIRQMAKIKLKNKNNFRTLILNSLRTNTPSFTWIFFSLLKNPENWTSH